MDSKSRRTEILKMVTEAFLDNVDSQGCKTSLPFLAANLLYGMYLFDETLSLRLQPHLDALYSELLNESKKHFPDSPGRSVDLLGHSIPVFLPDTGSNNLRENIQEEIKL